VGPGHVAHVRERDAAVDVEPAGEFAPAQPEQQEGRRQVRGRRRPRPEKQAGVEDDDLVAAPRRAEGPLLAGDLGPVVGGEQALADAVAPRVLAVGPRLPAAADGGQRRGENDADLRAVAQGREESFRDSDVLAVKRRDGHAGLPGAAGSEDDRAHPLQGAADELNVLQVALDDDHAAGEGVSGAGADGGHGVYACGRQLPDHVLAQEPAGPEDEHAHGSSR
jgi:hypothetical protein